MRKNTVQYNNTMLVYNTDSDMGNLNNMEQPADTQRMESTTRG